MKTIIKYIIITLFIIFFYSQLFAAVNDPVGFGAKNSPSSPVILERIHFRRYFHLRYSFIDNAPDNKVNEDHWSLRRFKLITDWKLSNRLQFYSQFIYKTNNYSSADDRVYLQDAFLKLFVIRQFNFMVGQFKPPVGWERFQPDLRLPVIEQSQAIDRLIPNGSLGESFVRDYGFQCFGKLSPVFQYEFTMMAGSGAHTKLSDKNAPLVVGRLSFKKKFKDPVFNKKMELLLQLANSQRWDTDNDFTRQLPGCDKNIFRHFSGRDNRYDYVIAINLERSQFAAEYLSTEYLADDDGQVKTRASGWFLEHSYFLIDNWQYVVRYEQFDPDHAKKDGHDLAWFTLGLDYYFNKKSGRLMVNYIIKNEATNGLRNNMLVVQFQYFLFGGK